MKALSNLNGKPHIVGVNDCNLMVFEITGFDLTKIEPFNTVRGGMKSLRSASGCKTMGEYLLSRGYKQIKETLITDGCFAIKGIHSFYFYQGYMFGVNPNTNCFGFFKVNYDQLKEFEVYKWD